MSGVNLNADDPFKVLGVPRSKPIHEIQERTQELVTEYDNDDAITAIGNAFAEIQEGPHVKETDGTRIEPLIVETEQDTVAVNESVLVEVTDITGAPVVDAELKVGGEWKGHTDSDGEETVQLSDTGEREVIARKSAPDDNREYRNGDATVRVQKRSKSLELSEHPDSASIGDDFEVRVTGSNGDGVQGVEITGAEIEAQGTTDVDGWTTVTPTAIGSGVEVCAEKNSTSNREYDGDSFHLDVVEREVDLSFDNPPAEVTYGDSVDFRIVDGSGNGVSGVNVTGADGVVTTDDDGRARVEFDSASLGSHSISADKDSDERVHYAPANIEVSVTTRTVELDVDVLNEPVTVGENTTFLVTDEDEIPVESAYVSGTDGTSGRTDTTGRAEIRFDESGEKTVSASKHDTRDVREFRGDNITVEVKKRSEKLRFSNLPTDITVGETVSVGVDSVDGNSVSGVTVNAEDGTKARTGEDGIAYVRFAAGGRKELAASKPSTETTEYESASRTVEVDPEQRTLEFASCPDSAVAGETVSLRVEDDSGPVEGAKIQLSTGEEIATAADGTAEFTPSQNGNIVLTASKANTDSTVYNTTQESVDVSNRDIDIQFDQAPATAKCGTTEVFRIADRRGEGVRGVEISAAGASQTTDERGYAALSLDGLSPGKTTIRAVDPFQEGSMSSVTTEVEMQKNTIPLSIEVVDTAIVGQPVSFEVTNRHAEPVEAATVRCDDENLDDTTTEDGVATIKFESPGKQTVRAVKSDEQGIKYESDSIDISVQSQKVYLSISVQEDDINVGKTINAIVTSAAGKSVENAVVDAEDGTKVRTDAQGRAPIEFHSEGKKRIHVTKCSEDEVEYRPTYEHVEVG